ncbi:MAG: hypothetical protein IKO01_00325 [Kiritimatiellae bacterium]|nr:hypothetical protein [Kiritimatiellia bacterium]MBR4252457.1 hypothetical protein [Kiritimatiellia bacterium]
MEKIFLIFPMIGKLFSNGWKKPPNFSNDWKTFFQWLENRPGGGPAWSPVAGRALRASRTGGENGGFFHGGEDGGEEGENAGFFRVAK